MVGKRSRVLNVDVAVHGVRLFIRVVEVHAGRWRPGDIRLRHEDEPGKALTGILDIDSAEFDLCAPRMVTAGYASRRGSAQELDLPTKEDLVVLMYALTKAILD